MLSKQEIPGDGHFCMPPASFEVWVPVPLVYLTPASIAR